MKRGVTEHVRIRSEDPISWNGLPSTWKKAAWNTSIVWMRWAAWWRQSNWDFLSGKFRTRLIEYQKAVERKEKIIVGVNDFVLDDEPPMDILLDRRVRR